MVTLMESICQTMVSQMISQSDHLLRYQGRFRRHYLHILGAMLQNWLMISDHPHVL